MAHGASPDAPPDPALEQAWNESVAELRAARESLAQVVREVDDPWLVALARQDLFRARRRVLDAQEALTGAPAELPWSTS